MFLNKHKVETKNKINMNNIPKHIAIIMDGNGRWAKKRGLPRIYGHKAGIKTVKKVVKVCSDLSVKYLTLYAFSTENWKRPTDEVNGLMNLLIEYLSNEVDELNKKNVKVIFIGDLSKIPDKCNYEIFKAEEKTRNNTGLILNIAFNYSGRNDIINAVKKICDKVVSGQLKTSDINEDIINKNLYTYGQPDPDLILRSGGELRLSNFLIWQSAYSELWFSDVLWPDFNEDDLIEAIVEYQKRNRRFGGL
ncbi:isoprenyl transferase [Aceticella autotrophica]|uniref:Isoprenyl transferase n=1 Tax=Aceticella autotrophica TaxID=2755338 RepID=A0A975AXF6_9THEO|nr:isoprenyl transferase [Aceticella autotrophica]QSZ28245.1 isoprenyl transferase [Aceticella autotrophica]